MKPVERLGSAERSIVEERRNRGYLRPQLEHFGEVEADVLRAMLGHLLPGVPANIDLAAFVDAHLQAPLGRGDRRAGMPSTPELIVESIRACALDHYLEMSREEQRDVIARLRRGDMGDEGKVFIDRLLEKALQGYLGHPDAWIRIGFNGPAYPEGYAWIGTAEVAARHDKKAGWEKL